MRPNDCAPLSARQFEVFDVLQLTKDAEIQQRRAVENTELSIGELNFQRVIVLSVDGYYSRIHDSPQGFNLQWLLTVSGKLPIGAQFFSMNFDPCLDEPQLSSPKRSFQHVPVINRYYGFLLLIASLDMRPMVTPVVHKNTWTR
jgi:hypothetical protein